MFESLQDYKNFMTKIRPGNRQNSHLNGEWARHGRPYGKKIAAKKRRKVDKKEVKERYKETLEMIERMYED